MKVTAAGLKREMATVERTVVVPYLDPDPDLSPLAPAVLWQDLLRANRGAALDFEPVPADHPLWVLYSSGTTGLPKAIVQGHGGILLEHLKKLHLHVDDCDAWAKRAVEAGATLLSEPKDEFYGERGCRLRDPFGHLWLIGHSIEKVTPEEMQRRYTAMCTG